MRPFSTLLCVIFVFGCISCSHDNQFKEEILMLKSNSIILHFNEMQAVYNGRDTVNAVSLDGMKLIVFTDSSSCSVCALSRMYFWNDLLGEIKYYDEKLKVYFIFSPLPKDLPSVRLSLSSLHFNQIVHLDTLGVFIDDNKHIPHHPDMHTFLLDEDNNVLLVGNPLDNEKIEEMFWQIVEKKLGKRE